MRKRKVEEKKGAPEWLTTYSDLVTLLLCFFVLLFSFSQVDSKKFKSIMSSFQGSLGVLNGGTTTIEEVEELSQGSNTETDELEQLKDTLEEFTESKNLGGQITLSIEERGLVIRFLDSVIFDSGKADIKPEAKEILDYVAEILSGDEFKDKYIKVEGHTDSDPIIYSPKFATNWELSAIRATNVLRYLVEEENIDGSRISSSGYSYYRPVAHNDTKANKAKNRRVDIVVLKSSYEKWEPK